MVDRVCTLQSSVSWAKVKNSNVGSPSTSICLFINQTRELAPGSTFRFHFWLFETKEYGAKPSRQQTGVSCLQLAASATLVKVEDSNARSINFGFWLYEGDSIYNEIALITQPTHGLELYTIYGMKDQGFTFRMVQQTLFYHSYLSSYRL